MFGNFLFGLRFSSRRSFGKANQVAVGIKRKPLTRRTGTRPPVRFLVAQVAKADQVIKATSNVRVVDVGRCQFFDMVNHRCRRYLSTGKAALA
jgi:hypothetical protein